MAADRGAGRTPLDQYDKEACDKEVEAALENLQAKVEAEPLLSDDVKSQTPYLLFNSCEDLCVIPPEADVESSTYNLAVQYLSRVSKLRKRQQTPWIYHKLQCSDCKIPTRSLHVMWMKYVCTKCVNNNVMTNYIISRDVAKR